MRNRRLLFYMASTGLCLLTNLRANKTVELELRVGGIWNLMTLDYRLVLVFFIIYSFHSVLLSCDQSGVNAVLYQSSYLHYALLIEFSISNGYQIISVVFSEDIVIVCRHSSNYAILRFPRNPPSWNQSSETLHNSGVAKKLKINHTKLMPKQPCRIWYLCWNEPNNGEIGGYGRLASDPYYDHAFLLSYTPDTVFTPSPIFIPTPAIPELETYVMLLAGLGLIGFIARRKKK